MFCESLDASVQNTIRRLPACFESHSFTNHHKDTRPKTNTFYIGKARYFFLGLKISSVLKRRIYSPGIRAFTIKRIVYVYVELSKSIQDARDEPNQRKESEEWWITSDFFFIHGI